MEFPPGKTLLLIALFASLGGVMLLLLGARGGNTHADQVVWVFDASHAAIYNQPSGDQPALTQLYEQATHRQVQIQLLASRALDARLLSLILSNTRGPQVPDLVEIEIGSVGKYFRAPPQHNGLLPLEGFIARDPAGRELLPARLATWSNGGHIFGVPEDVHPVSITYRKDLFQEAGVDLAACQSWPQFHQACLAYQRYWRQHGKDRRAIQLSRWNASDLLILLQQQHLTLIDPDNQLHLTDARVARTVALYAQMIVGKDAIAASVSPANNLWVQDLADGNSAALFTPDWRVAYLRYQPALLGKLGMMPLPRFSPEDAPTASWGGTMMAIPRNARDPEASWQLLRFLQLSPQAMRARRFHSNILPAIRSEWSDPAWQERDPLYDGQPIGQLYIQLARELPEQHPSPYSTIVSQAVSGVLSAAQGQADQLTTDQLQAYCQQRLEQAQAELTKLLSFAENQP